MNNYIKKSVLIVIAAQDFNEQEFLTVKKSFIGAGFSIFTASDASGACSGSLGLKVKADVSFYNMNERSFCALVIIGGNGITKYFNNQILFSIIKKFNCNKKIVSAICGAPVVLAKSGILEGKNVTCFPALKDEIISAGANYKETNLIEDGNIITASGPLSSKEFAELIISRIR